MSLKKSVESAHKQQGKLGFNDIPPWQTSQVHPELLNTFKNNLELRISLRQTNIQVQ